MKSDIILFNMSSYSEWKNGVQNRNFHVFQALKNDPKIGKILLVNFLPYTLKKSLKVLLKELWKQHKNIIWKNLSTVVYEVEDNVYVYATIDSYFRKKQVAKNINFLLKKINFQNIIEWNYDILSYHLRAKQIDNIKLQVFDAVDNWLSHSSYKKYKEQLESNYKDIIQDSDCIFTVSENLRKLFLTWGDFGYKIKFISNASTKKLVEQQSVNTNLEQVQVLRKIKEKYKYILGYIGVIQIDRMDFSLLEYLAKKNKDKAIAMAGPVWKGLEREVEKLKRENPNVFFIGRVKREDWYDIASYFDLALSPHLEGNFMQYISPTKIYEYLSVGLPVVTTRISGVDILKDKILIVDGKEEFNDAIQEVLLEEKQEKKKLRRKDIADDHLWSNRYLEMQNFINQKLKND